MLFDHRGQPATVSTRTTKPALHVAHLQWGGNPFVSVGLDWCGPCQMEVDTETTATHRAGVYTYSRRCGRCGQPIKWGAYSVPIIAGEGLPSGVVEFVTTPGKDRR